jgi:methionyl-tRNA synthetase
VLSWPVIPSTSQRVLDAIGGDPSMPPWPSDDVAAELALLRPGTQLGELDILFRKITPEEQQALEDEFGGPANDSAGGA